MKRKKFVIILSVILWTLFLASILQFVTTVNSINSISTEDISKEIDSLMGGAKVSDRFSITENSTHYQINTTLYCEGDIITETNRIPKQGEYSVYVLGGSSVRWHDCKTEILDHFLEKELEKRYPERDVGVYNFGRSGFSSFPLVTKLEELVNTEPEMVYIYSGHNDYSNVHFKVVREKLGVFFGKNILSEPVKFIIEMATDYPDLRRQAARRNMISFLREKGVLGSKVDQTMEIANRKTLEYYKKNIETMYNLTSSHGTVLLVSTVMSNLKHKPSSPTVIKEGEKKRFYRLKEEGENLFEQGEYQKAVRKLKAAENLTEKSSKTNYRIGIAYLRMGDEEKGTEYLTRAKDQDNLNYEVRAKSGMNDYIRTLGDERTHLENVELKKRMVERDDIYLDRSLFEDSIHINWSRGYRIWAEETAEAIEDKKIIEAER